MGSSSSSSKRQNSWISNRITTFVYDDFHLAMMLFFRWSKTFLPKLHKGIFLAKKKYSTYFPTTFFAKKYRVSQQVLDLQKISKCCEDTMRKKSWKFVYILIKKCRTPFNLTNYFIKKSRKAKKFVKVCLHSSYIAQYFIQFDKKKNQIFIRQKNSKCNER